MRLVRSPAVLDELRVNVQPPRTTDDVAADMATLYESLKAATTSGAGTA
jgi:hypothetical protein